ncbi:MAG TPA: asparaginase [Jatrophihabitans sp.]|jgi:L-asparaginase
MPETATVTLFTTGGTISAVGGDAAGRLTGAQILAATSTSADVAVQVCDFRRLPSASLTFEDVAELADRIEQESAAGAGVVVVQGTDTIEETAFLLDLLCRSDTPVVVTGAMRRPDVPGADGPANLAAAIAVAADPDCAGLGVLVVFADEIHAARHVRKTHTTSIATFASPTVGALGLVVEGEPRILLRPTGPTLPQQLRLRRQVRVALVSLALGDRGELLEAVDGRFDGLVVVGFGAGHVPSWLVEPLGDLAGRMPVVLASRTGSGQLLTHTYRGPGSESDLHAHGLISAGYLDPPKARVLLHALLADEADHSRVVDTFDALAR